LVTLFGWNKQFAKIRFHVFMQRAVALSKFLAHVAVSQHILLCEVLNDKSTSELAVLFIDTDNL
jgi:hypothetical protein